LILGGAPEDVLRTFEGEGAMDGLCGRERVFDEAAIVSDLATMRYEDVAARHGTSRGKVYQIALKRGARKYEDRIRERALERKRRREDFLREVLNATTQGDVLEFLDGIPDGCVQLHCTSIPYNMAKPYGGHRGADSQRALYYYGWMVMVLSEMTRTLAPGGVMYLNMGATRDDDGSLIPLDILLFEPLRRLGLSYNSRITWEVPHGLTPRGRLAERAETILVFSKGPARTFNPTPLRRPQLDPAKRAFKGPRKGQLSGHPLGKHPTNVWRIPNVGHNHPEKAAGGGHPAQFPQEIARNGILLYTLPNDLVCDVFVGSGTTAVEAVRTGRHFVGADLFYEAQRASRLAKVVPDVVTLLPGVTDESVAVWQAEAVPVLRDAERAVDFASLDREAEQLLLSLPETPAPLCA
jgi:DNA modification methylase